MSPKRIRRTRARRSVRIKHSPNAPCPCHSGLKYKGCCNALHRGLSAPSARHLMRARYAAYALGLADFVMHTTAKDGPQWRDDTDAWRAEIQTFSTQTRFVGLEIVDHSILDDDTQTVAFNAQLVATTSQQDQSFSEHSLFRRAEGTWYYVGIHAPMAP